ncbi:MAG: FAD-dependent oxidoreductase [Gammaproteobacteria bacterium]|nr:FAD-dependent oxidoreductase [Gammaproteobacteria bacterium]NNF61385.1 FAD-dependent oxidoreductase [Gammaproteobacteria bacterium]
MRVVVAGGGYGGLACLAELSRCCRDVEMVLVDPGADHVKQTHLHETVRRPLARFRIPYKQLASRFGFRHVQASADLSDLGATAQRGVLQLDEGNEPFDFLVVATGASAPPLPKCQGVYDRADLRALETRALLDDFLADDARPPTLTVVGGGPTGIQFLFELSDAVSRAARPLKLRLVDREPALLREHPAALGDYVSKKIAQKDIEYLPGTEYAGCEPGLLQLRGPSGEKQTVESGLTLLLPGVRPSPLVNVNRFGHLAAHENIFAAGDCARYDARGDDFMTAQVAVRQAKLVARNIDRLSRGVRPLEYFFRELGYVVSLGPVDAVGWLLLKDQVVSGLPAFAIKEVVEAQYDLFVAGLDTYLV